MISTAHSTTRTNVELPKDEEEEKLKLTEKIVNLVDKIKRINNS